MILLPNRGLQKLRPLETSHTFGLILLVFILTEVSCSPFSLIQGLAVKCLASGLAIIMKKEHCACGENATTGSKGARSFETARIPQISLCLALLPLADQSNTPLQIFPFLVVALQLKPGQKWLFRGETAQKHCFYIYCI